jgi:phosphoglycolate phosphatase
MPKPNPSILHDIVDQVGADPAEAIYVGDSLTKDVAMARQAGITDVYVEFGVSHDKGEYELLRQVTHWTSDQVEAEKLIRVENVKPTYILRHSFCELLTHFHFIPLPKAPDTSERVGYFGGVEEDS